MKLSKDQSRILKWMRSHESWKTSTEIGNTVGGWNKGSTWASRKCQRLVIYGYLEQGDDRKYRAIGG